MPSVVKPGAGSRGGTWDAFYAEEWTTPPTQAPERVLPYGNLSLLVREGDVVDGIVYEDGARSLEFVLGEVMRAGGARGRDVRPRRGRGLPVGRTRRRADPARGPSLGRPAPPGGDWALLCPGTPCAWLAADTEHGGTRSRSIGCGRASETLDASGPSFTWTGRRPRRFPGPTRRAGLEAVVDDGTFDGELDGVSPTCEPGVGPGPLLPVRALFEVAGRCPRRWATSRFTGCSSTRGGEGGLCPTSSSERFSPSASGPSRGPHELSRHLDAVPPVRASRAVRALAHLLLPGRRSQEPAALAAAIGRTVGSRCSPRRT